MRVRVLPLAGKIKDTHRHVSVVRPQDEPVEGFREIQYVLQKPVEQTGLFSAIPSSIPFPSNTTAAASSFEESRSVFLLPSPDLYGSVFTLPTVVFVIPKQESNLGAVE